MRYVQINSGSFLRHIPSDVENLRFSPTVKTSVRKLTDEQRDAFGIKRLQLVTPPPFDPATQTRDEGDAELVGDVWTQQWAVTDLVDDDLADAQAREAERQRQAGLDAAVNADSTLAALKAMTNPEYNAWFDANVTTAASVRVLLKRILRVLIRRVL